MSADETKLDGQTDKAVQPVVIKPPPVAVTTTATAPVVASVSDVMKIDGSPLLRKAIPKTEPHPTPTSIIPATSTGIVKFKLRIYDAVIVTWFQLIPAALHYHR